MKQIDCDWHRFLFPLNRLDFLPRGDVFARFTHLQHIPFTITLSVNNTSNEMKFGMSRIFMAPKLGFNKQVLHFNEQRMLMIEIDKFIVPREFL